MEIDGSDSVMLKVKTKIKRKVKGGRLKFKENR
jgi:hypothetical protein